MSEVNREGLTNAEVVAALVNGTRPLGLGVLHDKGRVTSADFEDYDKQPKVYLDYVHGRPLKCALDANAPTFNAALYDRDAGHGRAEKVIAEAKQRKTNAAK